METNRPSTPNPPGNPAPPKQTPSPSSSKIQHTKPAIGQPVQQQPQTQEIKPVPIAETTDPLVTGGTKITALGSAKRHEDKWTRKPNTPGNGAIHVRTFHCKLTDDALNYMDQSINEWLDAHPEYEVKFVNSTIGILTGKLKDPALICQIWV